MSAHTQAPWSVITLKDGFQFIVNDETKVTVCLAPELPLHNGVKAWPANSRLIAAAPELLEALNGLASFPLEQFDYDNAADDKPIFGANGDWLLTVGMVRKARAAIAKATQP